MKRIPATELEQNSQAWFDARTASIGGSDDKGLKPLSRGKYKGLVEGAVGFWKKLIAEKLALQKDGESERERGHRLEDKARECASKKLDIEFVKAGMWLSSVKGSHVSPDSEEDVNEPTYAQEIKAFDSDKHLRIMYEDLLARKEDGYEPFNSIPDDNQDQVIKLFNVNDKLETVYWTLFDDRQSYEEFECYIIKVKRNDLINELVEDQRTMENNAIKRSKEIVKFMLDELKGKK